MGVLSQTLLTALVLFLCFIISCHLPTPKNLKNVRYAGLCNTQHNIINLLVKYDLGLTNQIHKCSYTDSSKFSKKNIYIWEHRKNKHSVSIAGPLPDPTILNFNTNFNLKNTEKNSYVLNMPKICFFNFKSKLVLLPTKGTLLQQISILIQLLSEQWALT